jgi:hypothetical protein
MGLAFLKMDRSRVKWRIKLAQAFDNKVSSTGLLEDEKPEEAARAKKEARNGKWALFLLPFITVLREGVEAVVFVGGVSWTVERNLPRTSPLLIRHSCPATGITWSIRYFYPYRNHCRTYCWCCRRLVKLHRPLLSSRQTNGCDTSARLPDLPNRFYLCLALVLGRLNLFPLLDRCRSHVQGGLVLAILRGWLCLPDHASRVADLPWYSRSDLRRRLEVMSPRPVTDPDLTRSRATFGT